MLKHVGRRVFEISSHDLFAHDDHYRLHGIEVRELGNIGWIMQNFGITLLKIGPTQSARNLSKRK